jgi:hypothetical protein
MRPKELSRIILLLNHKYINEGAVMKSFFFSIFLSIVSVSALASEWQASSHERQTAVIELFTAEGCGLCPAADKWVSSLPEQGYDDNRLMVLGFHIDYLNNQKQWVDKFAKPEYTARQKEMARMNFYKTVFTPEFFIGGEVIHNWESYAKSVIDHINTLKPEANIAISAKLIDTSMLNINTEVEVLHDENVPHAVLYIALTENNVRSEIHGGDNIGATFNHQNLVRAWLGPFKSDNASQMQLETSIALAEEWKQEDLVLKAFVQNVENAYVLQGVALPLK